ncbi:MAG: glycosyltransferase family 2 protein [Melioribacteraceae bacterium]|nr:glycosyltransferase family 2 protein [Melioribacteraceae bacterium]
MEKNENIWQGEFHKMVTEKRSEPLVTIILPTYNREKYLKRSIDSVQNQAYKNWELLIIDDGSSDATLSLVKNYLNQFSNIRYFFHENRGAAYSMNIGMQKSKGEFITFIGSDDEYMENHLKLRIDYFRNKTNVDLLLSPARIIGDKYVKDKNDKTKKIHLDDCTLGGTLFGKAEVFKKLNGFKELNYSPESEFIERVEKIYRIEKFNSRTYIYYRDTPDAICNNI